MTEALSLARPSALPALVAASGERAGIRVLEFFASTIRNVHTRRAYGRAVADFLAWCEEHAVPSNADVSPLHVAAWIELQTTTLAAPTAKLRLAAIRHPFDWLVMGQVVPINPAASVRGPAHSVRKGKTPVLDPAEARTLLDSIDVTTQIGLRDRALIGLMVYSFGRIGAALAMRVEDVFTQNRRLWVRLRERRQAARDAVPSHVGSLSARQSGRRRDRRRSEGSVPHDRTGNADPNPHTSAPGQCLCDGAPAGLSSGDRDQDRQPQFPGDGHNRLPEKRRHASECRRHGQSRKHAHYSALRSAAR